MRLSGKVALVTGSTSGVGSGIARALADSGAHVMLNGFGDKALIDALIANIGSQCRVKVSHSGADMSKPGEIEAMVSQAVGELGGVDILVNNAGVQHVAPVEEFPVDQWDAVIAINLSAAFHAIRAALPTMKDRHWGRIVNIASTHGLVGSVPQGGVRRGEARHRRADQGGRAGNRDHRHHLQRDLSGLGPHADRAKADRRSRAPGKSAAVDAAKMKLLGEKQPSLGFATPEQIGAATLFLCSDAAEQIRGIALPIDGGWTAQ